MIRELARPFRPVEPGPGTLAGFDVPALAEALRKEEEYAKHGVAALTLFRDAHLTTVMVALRAGSEMKEHRAPSAGSVVLLSGRVTFVDAREGEAAEPETVLTPGCVAIFSEGLPHAVRGLEDALYVIHIGGRKRPAS